MAGAIERANQENLAEVKRALERIGRDYGLSCLKLIASVAGLPGPLADLTATVVKNCYDAFCRHDTEEAEFRAKTALNFAAHCESHRVLYDSVTPDRLRSLYQRVTRRAVELRQEESVRLMVAAYLGGSDGQLASPIDLYTAEWLESLPDSRLRHLQNVCTEMFSPVEIPVITDPPQRSESVAQKFSQAPTKDAVQTWRAQAIGWPDFADDLFHRVSSVAYCSVLNQCRAGFGAQMPQTFSSEHRQWTAIEYFPNALVQRVHNAFRRAHYAMKYELERYAEGVPESAR
jgi:hypothetical protein